MYFGKRVLRNPVIYLKVLESTLAHNRIKASPRPDIHFSGGTGGMWSPCFMPRTRQTVGKYYLVPPPILRERALL